jgi:glycosidase
MPEDVEAQSSPLPEEEKALTDEKQVEIVKASNAKVEPCERKGLTKEELMKYANDPFWIRLRIGLFALFWLIWVGMLVASVVIIIYAPKCPSPEPKAWWQKGPIYKVDPSEYAEYAEDTENKSSFFLNIVDDLGYMVDAGFNTLYLGNIFKISDDEGTVVDFFDINPSLGTLEEWTTLTAELQQRNIKVIIDFSPDLTSLHHAWYEQANPGESYEGFYVAGTQQLDISNPKVVTELQKVITTWADRGVSGFNIKSTGLISNLISNNENYQDAKNLIVKLRQTLDGVEPAEQRILTAFTDLDLTQLGPLYGDNVQINHVGSLFHLASGKSLVESLPDLTASHVFDYVQSVQNSLPDNSWPGVALSSRTVRVADTNADMVDAVNMLASMLKATPIVRAGDELGFVSGEQDWSARGTQSKETLAGHNTHFGVFSQMAELRHTETILFGDVYNNEIDGCSVITRVKRGNPGIVLVINMNNQNSTLDISNINGMGETVRLKARSVSANPPTPEEEVKAYPAKEVAIAGRDAKLFTFVPNL